MKFFGGGFGSRLFPKGSHPTRFGLRGRRRRGSRCPTTISGSFRRSPHQWSVSTVEDANKAAQAEIAGLNRPFAADELQRAKSDIVNSFLFDYDTKDKILDESEKLEFYGYPADYLETYHAALEKVTLADLAAAAKKYIHPEKLAVLVVGNGPEIKPGLDGLGMGAPQPIDITIPPPPGAPAAGGAA